MTAKETAIELIRALPDEATEEEIIGQLDARFGLPENEKTEAPTDAEWEADWLEEVERRIEDARSGKTVGIPAEEFMQQMRKKYG